MASSLDVNSVDRFLRMDISSSTEVIFRIKIDYGNQTKPEYRPESGSFRRMIDPDMSSSCVL